MNVWERIKGFIKKIKENKKDQLTLNEKNEIREIVENTNQNNTPDLNQEKQQFVKNVNEDEITTTYVVNINGWVENRLQREIRNICINTVLPTFKGELIEKHRKRVEELLVNAISEQADADKYEARLTNTKSRCYRKFINPYLKKVTNYIKEWIKDNDIDTKNITENQLESAFKNSLLENRFIQDITEKAVQIMDKGIVTFEIGNFGNIVSMKFVANEKVDLCYDDKAYTKKVTTIQVVSGQSHIVEKSMKVIHKVTNAVEEAYLELTEVVDMRDKDGSFISNVCTKTFRKLVTNETPEFIMQKYEKGIYLMDIDNADYYTRNILAKKDGDIVWKKITTKPGQENECKVVIYPEGNIGGEEIKKENIKASEVESAWKALKACGNQDEALPLAE